MFYNHPRYDGVINNTTNGLYVAQLIQLFECEFDRQRYPLALVHPYDAPVTLDKSQCFCTYENRENIQIFFTVSFLKKNTEIFLKFSLFYTKSAKYSEIF